MNSLRELNLFDWFLVAILAWSTVGAFLRGFFREAFSLAGLVAGILLASWNYPTLAARLVRWMPLRIAEVASFLLIALLTMALAGLIGKLLQKTAKTVGLGFADRLLGAGFGLLRGFLIGVAVMMAAAAFVPSQTFLKNSALSGYFLAAAHGVSFVVPGRLEARIRTGAIELRHSAPDWIKPRMR